MLKITSLKFLFSGRASQTLMISHQRNAARDCDLVKLARHEFVAAKVAVEGGGQYRIFLKVVSSSARRDAAMLTFSVDVPLNAEDAVKYFPRFTTAVGKPFTFVPNQSEEQNEGLTLVRFTAPPGARFLTIGARRWATDGDVEIGKCLVLEPQDGGTVSALDCTLPAGRFCELLIDAGKASHLSTVAVFTAALNFRDAEQRPLPAGNQVFRCAAYPGSPPAEAALPVPVETPAGAVTASVSIASGDEQLPGLVQITPRALAQPVAAAAFLSSLKDRLDRRAAVIRMHAGQDLRRSKDEVDDWLCSEKAAVLQRAATLFRLDSEAETSPPGDSASLPVVPGTIIEIRLVPVLVPPLPEPSTATLKLSFFDSDGRDLPDAGHQASWSRWTRRQYPLSFEAEAFDQQAHFAVPHYVVVPPFATSLNVEVQGTTGNSRPRCRCRL